MGSAETPVRRRGLSVRWRLTLSYAGFLVLAGSASSAGLLLVLRYVPDGNLVVAGTGNFVPDRYDLLRVGVPLAVSATAFLAAVGLVGGWWLAGRMLRPLTPIAEATRLAAQGSLSHRIALEGPDDEFRRLADVFDTMLARLQTSFEEQRRFTANASHELRTPQAVVKTLLEVARENPADRDVDVLLARLADVNDRSIAVLEALLDLSRAESGSLRRERLDLARIVDGALEDVVGLAGRHHVVVDVDTATAPVVGDPDLLTQLVANLLRNAVLHNLPDPGGRRTGGAETDGDENDGAEHDGAEHDRRLLVRTEPAGSDGAVLRVENTGEVLDPEVVATLTEPFVRARGRTRSHQDGSGLGLTIVASVARAHGAGLTVRARPGGGLSVTVGFPSAGLGPWSPPTAP